MTAIITPVEPLPALSRRGQIRARNACYIIDRRVVYSTRTEKFAGLNGAALEKAEPRALNVSCFLYRASVQMRTECEISTPGRSEIFSGGCCALRGTVGLFLYRTVRLIWGVIRCRNIRVEDYI